MCSLFIHRRFLSLPGVSFSSPGRTPAAQKTSEDPATFTLNPFPLILTGFFKKLYNPWVCAISNWRSVSSQRQGPHCSNCISFEFQEKSLDILVVCSFTVISTHIKLYALHFNEVVCWSAWMAQSVGCPLDFRSSHGFRVVRSGPVSGSTHWAWSPLQIVSPCHPPPHPSPKPKPKQKE